ncbi:MAG: M48 family metallopeptidase [Bacteroidota bacterium]
MIITEQDHTLRIGNASIPYAVKRGRPNRVRLSFSEDNQLWIETGTGQLGHFERDFLVSKSRWILRSYRNRLDEHDKKARFLAGLEHQVLLLGEETAIDYQVAAETSFHYKVAGPFTVYAPERFIREHRKALIYQALRKFAEQYLPLRLEHWSEVTDLGFNRVRIKDLRSKWGSCSSRRNINLNWQLVFLTEKLIDYVLVHELMHLREMNHSPQFWKWVEKYCPDYKILRNQLKEVHWLVGILK